MEYQRTHSTPERLFRHAILNGITPPADVRATLEARGVNTDALEARLRQSWEFKH
jgi:hypothetical protein